MLKEHTIPTPEGDIKLSTGKIAMLADASVFVQKGGTVLHATASVSNKDVDRDYLPLSINYAEKMYASGRISGSRFVKREGRPSPEATIRGRVVDHSIRPLFPKGLRREVTIVLEVLAYDGKNNPEDLSVFAASTASIMAGLPFSGPAAGVVIGIKEDGSLVVNPMIDQESELVGEYVVSGVKDGILNIEGWSEEATEETMKQILDLAAERITALCAAQKEFTDEVAKPEIKWESAAPNSELVDKIYSEYGDRISASLYIADKRERTSDELASEIVEALMSADEELSLNAAKDAVTKVEQKIMRAGVLKESKRFSGRGLEEVRELIAEVDILPTVHGSALFSRGLTQCLSIVALGSKRMVKLMDDMYGESEKAFMHHYKMPGYTVGEAGRYMQSPNNREIGHGAIGENALKNAIASSDEFPYTIRVASEIMSSNGSTSMAATCAASLALMAAGVPMKSAVAGIGVGLVAADQSQEDYKLILDIEGVEDFFGDMDFKVTGTKDGITAIQFETKLEGVRVDILKQSFDLSKTGRDQVLEAMNKAISESRTELAESAPRVQTIKIDPEMIGMIIGPGGKNIKALIENANQHGTGEVDINIEDDGSVFVTATNEAQMQYVVGEIKAATVEPEIGEIYEGVIDKIMTYGAFVDISANLSGLIHVSELADGFVKEPESVVSEGDKVRVKLIKNENGKYSFSLKQAQEKKSE